MKRSVALLPWLACLACEPTATESAIPEDVKIRRAEVEAFDGRCDTDDSEACLLTAWAHTTGRSMPVDLSLAAQYYQRACELDEPSACLGLAALVRKGEGGMEADRSAATRLQARACDLGSSFACRQVAEAHHHGLGAERSKKLARQFLASACEFGDSQACEPGPDIFDTDLEEHRREDIRADIRGRLSDLRACYDRVAGAQSSLRGRVVLNFEVACDGFVGGLELVESTFGGEEGEFMTTCVQRMVGDWEFSPPAGGVAVKFHYPFTFGPS